MLHTSSLGRKRVRVGGGPEELRREISQLLALDEAILKQRWSALFGTNSALRLGRGFMVRAIAYQLQERAFGGLKPSTIRILERAADGRTELAVERQPRRAAGAGTLLIREWRGVRHRVTVLDHDVVYRGRRYKSLSQVARVITGTRWSGPLFFGLRSKAKEAADG